MPSKHADNKRNDDCHLYTDKLANDIRDTYDDDNSNIDTDNIPVEHTNNNRVIVPNKLGNQHKNIHAINVAHVVAYYVQNVNTKHVCDF